MLEQSVIDHHYSFNCEYLMLFYSDAGGVSMWSFLRNILLRQFLLLGFFLFTIVLSGIASATSDDEDQLDGKWILSENLKPGMKLITADNKVLTVMQTWQQKDNTATTYNFTIDDHHTYFIGKQTIWTHNTTQCDGSANDSIYNTRADNLVRTTEVKPNQITQDGLTFVRQENGNFLPMKEVNLKTINLANDQSKVLMEMVEATQKASNLGSDRIVFVFDVSQRKAMPFVYELIRDLRAANASVKIIDNAVTLKYGFVFRQMHILLKFK